ncbi:MAG: heme exporter protein CcmD [Planctomycetes bacterium]|nr:heme exporter protein CcmD [Planctomycetota bacterium]
MSSYLLATIAVSLIGQAADQAAAPPPSAAPDFRFHVWLAYGLVLVLLALFTLWTVAQIRGATRKLDHLKDVVEKNSPGARQG